MLGRGDAEEMLSQLTGEKADVLFTKDSDGSSSSRKDTSSSVRMCSGRVLNSGDKETNTGTDGSGLDTLLDGGLGVIDNILRRHGVVLMVESRKGMEIDDPEKHTKYVTG